MHRPTEAYRFCFFKLKVVRISLSFTSVQDLNLLSFCVIAGFLILVRPIGLIYKPKDFAHIALVL